MPLSDRTVEMELSHLRRDLKRQKMATCALFGIALVGTFSARGLTQAPAPRDLTVRTLKIVGSDGKPRALISGDAAVNKDGGAVVLFDARGVPRIGLMAGPNGSNISLLNGAGDPIALLAADIDGGSMGLTSASGAGKVNMAAVNKGVGLNMVAADGKTEVNVAADAEGSGLQVHNSGKSVMMAGGDKLGGVIEVYGANGVLKKRLP